MAPACAHSHPTRSVTFDGAMLCLFHACAGFPASVMPAPRTRCWFLDDFDTVVAGDEQHIGRSVGEQANSHHPRQLVELLLEGRWVADGEVVDIEDVIAVVGSDPLTPDGASAKCDELTGHERARHGDHFDWEWELTQAGNDLGVVDYTNELRRSGGDDLLACEC